MTRHVIRTNIFREECELSISNAIDILRNLLIENKKETNKQHLKKLTVKGIKSSNVQRNKLLNLGISKALIFYFYMISSPNQEMSTRTLTTACYVENGSSPPIPYQVTIPIYVISLTC